MKKIITVVLILISSSIYSQDFFTIGSTKKEVLKIQGTPTSVRAEEVLSEEVWAYGSEGLASITFKKGKVKGYDNHRSILKVSMKTKFKNESKDEVLSPDEMSEFIKSGMPEKGRALEDELNTSSENVGTIIIGAIAIICSLGFLLMLLYNKLK